MQAVLVRHDETEYNAQGMGKDIPSTVAGAGTSQAMQVGRPVRSPVRWCSRAVRGSARTRKCTRKGVQAWWTEWWGQRHTTTIPSA